VVVNEVSFWFFAVLSRSLQIFLVQAAETTSSHVSLHAYTILGFEATSGFTGNFEAYVAAL
jgi:hypothetical protein